MFTEVKKKVLMENFQSWVYTPVRANGMKNQNPWEIEQNSDNKYYSEKKRSFGLWKRFKK